MPLAAGTNYFCSSAVAIRNSFYCSFDGVVEGWPLTVGIKFVGTPVKVRPASLTCVCAFFTVQVIFSCRRSFYSLDYDYAFFFGIEHAKFNLWHSSIVLVRWFCFLGQ